MVFKTKKANNNYEFKPFVNVSWASIPCFTDLRESWSSVVDWERGWWNGKGHSWWINLAFVPFHQFLFFFFQILFSEMPYYFYSDLNILLTWQETISRCHHKHGRLKFDRGTRSTGQTWVTKIRRDWTGKQPICDGKINSNLSYSEKKKKKKKKNYESIGFLT